jgi:L-threonylcarbamoyladenylate synthase
MVRIDAKNPEASILHEAADVLLAGGLVAFPTETVYGLGANALDTAAVAGIFAAKGRPANNPLIVHVDGESMLRQVAADWRPVAAQLAARFWPGPLTFVVRKTSAVPDIVTGGGPTVAVRMPAHPVAIGLIRMAGVPLAAPSANVSNQLSPTRAEHVLAGMKGRIDLILDGGPTTNGIESTVIDISEDQPTLLRPGPISLAQLEQLIGPVQRSQESTSDGALPSPGLLPRHYAPRTPAELVSDRAELRSRLAELAGPVVSVVIGPADDWLGDVVEMPPGAASYGARIYAVLHELDARGLSHILIEMPPATDEWVAVRDRLTRATST